MDRQQSWEWVTQHRLPLFLRSDLYSEYKLCKLLTIQHTLERSATSSSVTTDSLRPQKSQSATRLPSKKSHTELPIKGSSSAVCLPSLGPRDSYEDSPPLGNTLPLSAALGHHVSGSKSDVELGHKGQQRQRSSGPPLKSPSQQTLLQKQLTADVPCIVLDEESPEKTGGMSACSRSSVKGCSMRMNTEDFEFLGTKSGMSALWKFLRGTMGERNWLFWLDTERVRYYTKPIDQQRYIHYVNVIRIIFKGVTGHVLVVFTTIHCILEILGREINLRGGKCLCSLPSK